MSIITTAGGSTVGVDSSSTSVDNHLVRWDGVSGGMIQDNGVVTVSDNGIMLGLTDVSVGEVHINGHLIESLGANTALTLSSQGTGGIFLNSVRITNSQNIDAVNDLDMDGNFTMSGGNHIVHNNDGTVHYSLYRDNGKGIIQWRTTAGVRNAWMGFGSSGSYLWNIRNEVAGGDISLQPDNASGNGLITMKGFTSLGGSSPAIKMKRLTKTTSASSSGDVSVAHGLDATKIIGITGIIEVIITGGGSNAYIPLHYEGGSGNYDWDLWFDDTNVHIINAGSIITSSVATLTVTYEE